MIVLAVGAHPDDVELGAGVLIQKLVSQGDEVYFLILTDDDVTGQERRQEALMSANELGILKERVIFAGFRDGYLRTDRSAVSIVRSLTTEVGIHPELVVVHTAADSHNDHVEANRLAKAAFRNCAVLQYSVHLSAELTGFHPRLFVKVGGERAERKIRALSHHASQQARIGRSQLAVHEKNFGLQSNLNRAEAMEVTLQKDCHDALGRVMGLNESSFHDLWMPIIGENPVHLLYSSMPEIASIVDWPSTEESWGRDELRNAFVRNWYPDSPMTEVASDHPDAWSALENENAILVGGAVGNELVRSIFNRFRLPVWVIDFDVPRVKPAYLLNRENGFRWYPKMVDGAVVRDYGFLANMVNPFREDRRILCVAGATGVATHAGLSFLARSDSYPDVRKRFVRDREIQVAFEVDVADRVMRILEEGDLPDG
ncbi:PIG-L deacetylase family protein [Streptomyces cyaneofuscatus]